MIPSGNTSSVSVHGPATALLLLAFLILFQPVSLSQTMKSPRTLKQDVIDAHRSSIPDVTAAKLTSISARLQLWHSSNEILHRRGELRGVNGLSLEQIHAYEELKSAIPSLTIHWDEAGKTPIFISGTPLFKSLTATGDIIAEHTARAFLNRFSALLGCGEISSAFRLRSSVVEEHGRTHLKFSQHLNGLPLWGREIIVHFNTRGDIDLFTGRYIRPDNQLADRSEVSRNDAVQAAVDYVSQRTVMTALTGAQKLLFGYHAPSAHEAYLKNDEHAALQRVYVVELRPSPIEHWRCFVSTADGKILQAYNTAFADGPETADAVDLNGVTRSIDTYLHQGSYYMIDASRPMFNSSASVFPDATVGTISTLDAANTELTTFRQVISSDNTWTATAAVSAQHNAALLYEYFLQTHGWDSVDGEGGSMLSVVNVSHDGGNLEKAVWNGGMIIYGNGGSTFKPLAGALDIAAHEMTHGVIENSAAFEYTFESGALHEAFADIFAVMADRDDWQIGEDVVKDMAMYPSGAIRDLSNPANGSSQGNPPWQPDHMDDYQHLLIDQNNGGVHVNSGIPAHAVYLIADAIGKDKTEQIMFSALTTKLTRLARFVDFRLGVIRSAEELYGAGSAEALACVDAMNRVGIGDGSPTVDPDDYPPVDGVDRMLFTNTDPFLPAPLWIAVPPARSDADFTSVSYSAVNSRPSIPDDGRTAVFIDTSFNLLAVSLQGAPNEQVIDGSEIWNTVAISRDGQRVAVTTIQNKPQIFVLDISGPVPVSRSFPVETPGYSGSAPGIAQFVDAMDFSLDDRYLLFDVYNEISIDGTVRPFWDICVMDIWDKDAGDYADGRIERVLPLTQTMQYANPSWSKTRPGIFAFDAMDSELNKGFVIATDHYKGIQTTIVELPYNIPGYPNYSGKDTVLSFRQNDAGVDVIYNVEMDESGIVPAGQPKGFIPFATYPLWLRTGSRPLAADHVTTLPSEPSLWQNYPNPFNPTTTIGFDLPAAASIRLSVHDILGRQEVLLHEGRLEAGYHSTQWNGSDNNGKPLPSGLYYYRLIAGTHVVTRSMLLLK